jgi:hypothetical protein
MERELIYMDLYKEAALCSLWNSWSSTWMSHKRGRTHNRSATPWQEFRLPWLYHYVDVGLEWVYS